MCSSHALREHRRDGEWPGEDDLVFPASNGAVAEPGEPTAPRAQARRAKRRGVSWVGFHAFRHTCASMLFAEGRNAVQVQRWLGHHSPAFTLSTYVHLGGSSPLAHPPMKGLQIKLVLVCGLGGWLGARVPMGYQT